jgi:hypothetical protein
MSLTDTDEIQAVIDAVNQGIDAHLEACYCPERGDHYAGGQRKAGTLVLCRTLDCVVSPESLPVLLRRLFELDDEAGSSLASTSSPSSASTNMEISWAGRRWEWRRAKKRQSRWLTGPASRPRA